MSAELGLVLLYTLGLSATIEWHLHQFRKCTGIRCDFEEACRLSQGGIAGMQYRALSQQGLCEFAGSRNAGTTVTTVLPV